jgi:hypothetical protein
VIHPRRWVPATESGVKLRQQITQLFNAGHERPLRLGQVVPRSCWPTGPCSAT